jgi:hypothetical protein
VGVTVRVYPQQVQEEHAARFVQLQKGEIGSDSVLDTLHIVVADLDPSGGRCYLFVQRPVLARRSKDLLDAVEHPRVQV